MSEHMVFMYMYSMHADVLVNNKYTGYDMNNTSLKQNWKKKKLHVLYMI